MADLILPDAGTPATQLIYAQAAWGKFLGKYQEEKENYSTITNYAVISINEDIKDLIASMMKQEAEA